MFKFAKLAQPNEVGWLLLGEESKDGSLTISDVLLPKQKVSACHFEMVADKVLTSIEHPETVKGFGHSHVTMGTFHSCTDDDTLEDKWSGAGRYGLSIVVSLPNEIRAYISFYKPVETKALEVPLQIVFSDDAELDEVCKKEFDERVEAYQWTAPNYAGGGRGHSKFRGLGLGYDEEGPQGETDPVTGFTKAELVEMSRGDAELCKLLNLPTKTVETGDPVVPIVKASDKCPNLIPGPKGNPLCFIQGPHYDCKLCNHDPSKYRLQSPKHPDGCIHFDGYTMNSKKAKCKKFGKIRTLEPCNTCKYNPNFNVKALPSPGETIFTTSCEVAFMPQMQNGFSGCLLDGENFTKCIDCGAGSKLLNGGSAG